jgi:murein DD-endopeptidase MepM/ murein hydrolase activator NlpD
VVDANTTREPGQGEEHTQLVSRRLLRVHRDSLWQRNRLAVGQRMRRTARNVAAVHSPATDTQASRGPASKRRDSILRVIVARSSAVGVVFAVLALVVSTSLPANAFVGPSSTVAFAATGQSTTQSLTVASIKTDAVIRDTYTLTLPPPPRTKWASGSASRNFSYTNDPNGTIQWPFRDPVPVVSGFGPRLSPCGSCSSFHDGLDLAGGMGNPIGAITAGVVSAVVVDRGGYGVHVIVDHVINGQSVQSLYAHMISGSPSVVVGQTVTVGQKLGLVGNTGASTGAHLHLGIFINNVPIDPFAWLKANAN